MRDAKSLSALVRNYKGGQGRRLADYLGCFEGLSSVEDAIRFACTPVSAFVASAGCICFNALSMH